MRKDGTRTDLGYFWSCRNYEQYGTLRCNNKYGINEPEAEEQVKQEILKLQHDIRKRGGGALLTNFKAYLRIMYELDYEADDVEAIRDQIAKIERKKNILLEDRLEGVMSKELYQKQVKALNDEAEELEARLKAHDLYEETIKREWLKFEAYKKKILSLDVNNLTNGDIKTVFNKIYVGTAELEGKARLRKYLIFSYAIMGYSAEELLDLLVKKGYSGNVSVIVNGENEPLTE